jgi:uncharacterized protein YaaR (DUF327 family)
MAYEAPEYGSDILGPESERPAPGQDEFESIVNSIENKSDIKRLQRFLNKIQGGGPNKKLKVDGRFGRKTKEAVRMFVDQSIDPDLTSKYVKDIEGDLKKQSTESKIIDELKEL